ncbi:Uncharacterized protein APZ42_005006, partial [Daphnia magna]
DNHSSHLDFSVIKFAKENGIHLLTFPPHCSHRLQPLDITVFGPFKSALKQAFNDWMLQHPGKRITIHDVAELSRLPYLASFTPANIIAGFKNSGISPFNRDIFPASAFLPSFSTDRPIGLENFDSVIAETSGIMLNSRIIAEEIRPYLALAESIAAPLSDGTSGAGTVAVVLPSTLRPFPQISPASTEGRRRTPGRTRILTDTPEKNAIEDAANRRAQQLPASQMEKSRKRIKRSLDLEA